jgi:WD40 repeat protein
MLAAVVSEDNYATASRHQGWGHTYLLLWDVITGWQRLRVTRNMDADYFAAFEQVAISPDSRLVATSSHTNLVEIWNGFTGDRLLSIQTENPITALTFSDDGLLLATGHQDGRVYLWDIRQAWQQAIPKRRMTAHEAEQCWRDLIKGGNIPAMALWRLLGDPDQTVEVLQRHLRPATTGKDIATLVAALNAPEREDRDTAEAELQQFGPSIAPILDKALHDTPSEEAAARIVRLMDSITRPMSALPRRLVLGIWLAEHLDTSSSRAILMATGAPDALVTNAAQEALRRLKANPNVSSTPASGPDAMPDQNGQ